jgi:mannose-6-phosphate isomerase-like protein (cupin superfamily)
MMRVPILIVTATLVASASFSGCSPRKPGASAAGASSASAQGLILARSEGERRYRRPPPNALANLTAASIIKVDRKNGGSPDLVMLYTEIPPGQGIQPHHHPDCDEILFIHQGSGVAKLGPRSEPVTTGGTVYIPKNTRASLQNTGTEPLVILAIFSRPGFEDYLRETSVAEGEKPGPMSVEELNRIRERYRGHIVFDTLRRTSISSPP